MLHGKIIDIANSVLNYNHNKTKFSEYAPTVKEKAQSENFHTQQHYLYSGVFLVFFCSSTEDTTNECF